MTLTKEEKVMALLNQWDPDGRHANGAGYRAYSYEGETIAQAIRSNSRLETIEKAILEAFVGEELNKNEVYQMAVYIKAAITK